MSVEIWPPIAPAQLKIEEDATQARELTWLLDGLQSTLASLKHGLEECYALLAPVEPGSTLVLSTPRAELVKGHVTRVGARLVKGTIFTKLRTIAPLSININPAQPIHLAPLVALNALLTQTVDLAALCLSEVERTGKEQGKGNEGEYAATATFLSSQLRLLAQGIEEASGILKGAPNGPLPPAAANLSRPGTAIPNTSSGSSSGPTSGNFPTGLTNSNSSNNNWTQSSAASTSFKPALLPTVSFHVTIQDACLVLHLRALEPADAPVNLGIKLALAIGTARRLEHDEAERVFAFRRHDVDPCAPAPYAQIQSQSQAQMQTGMQIGGQPEQLEPSHAYPTRGSRGSDAGIGPGAGVNVIPAGSYGGGIGNGGNNNGGSGSSSGIGGGGGVERVYVREKVRVESADPSLLSMSTKLSALSHTLGSARRNLAAVMGEDFES
ncbi:hypothetical protein F4777DRAFT_90531 [Nemania sp. FL0916]|nr:hypothetical protein F4777DRAFT_90531 [Nemania sp. FL0916]